MPVRMWSNALWDSPNQSEMMTEAWLQTRQFANTKPQPDWRGVTGPAAAVAMSIRRAEWTWPRYNKFVTRDGIELDMFQVCPADVEKAMQQDTEAVLWKTWTQTKGRGHLAPAPFVQSLVRLMSKRTKEGPAQ